METGIIIRWSYNFWTLCTSQGRWISREYASSSTCSRPLMTEHQIYVLKDQSGKWSVMGCVSENLYLHMLRSLYFCRHPPLIIFKTWFFSVKWSSNNARHTCLATKLLGYPIELKLEIKLWMLTISLPIVKRKIPFFTHFLTYFQPLWWILSLSAFFLVLILVLFPDIMMNLDWSKLTFA